MKNLLSVWLTLQKEDEKYLQKIISSLGKEYESPIFTPHLTLLSDTQIEIDKLKKIIDQVFSNVKKIKIKKINVSSSKLFFKTVFIEFELDEALKKVFINLSEKTDKRNINTFNPHISIIYKIMDEKEKLKILKKLKIKKEFVIDNVLINAPKENDKNFFDVENWRTLYKKKLNN